MWILRSGTRWAALAAGSKRGDTRFREEFEVLNALLTQIRHFNRRHRRWYVTDERNPLRLGGIGDRTEGVSREAIVYFDEIDTPAH